MANITVNIEVDSEQFETLCLNNINDLPKEKMEEVLLKAVETALMNDRTVTGYSNDCSILVTTEERGYSKTTKPTKLLTEVMQKINTEKYIEPIAELIGNYIKENYKELICEYMTTAICGMLFSPDKEYRIIDLINQGLNDALRRN